MKAIVGIRREDKNVWERRAPLTPEAVGKLVREEGLEFVVQPALARVYGDAEYSAAGATVAEDLGGCQIVLAVKEIPTRLLLPGKTYTYFSHTIKAQTHNMPMLEKLLELGCTLIDYELIVDDQGRRTVFFGYHAGLAGMGETLVALGDRLEAEGIANPFSALRQPHEYRDLASMEKAIGEVGKTISRDGLAAGLAPLVFGFSGYGNVSRGAQQVLDALPVIEVQPGELEGLRASGQASDRHVYKVVFKEEHTVEPIAGPAGSFDLGDFFAHPERYRGSFSRWLPHLDVLVNCIFWSPKSPRLVSRDDIRALSLREGGCRLRVVGDISCDIDGGVEFTTKATMPDEPCFTWDWETDSVTDGVARKGVVVMAVDNLPCELAREASETFSRALVHLVPAIARTDWGRDLEEQHLPAAIMNAIIAHRGRLLPRFAYLEEAVRSSHH